METYITVDLETTGFSSDVSEIIEIGAWKVEGNVITDKFCTLVRPNFYIPRNIETMTGITNKMVSEAESIDKVLPRFYEWSKGYDLLGHNLPFDYEFLCKKGKPLGLDFTEVSTRKGVDTLHLARTILNLKHNKLKDVASYFNLVLDEKKGGYHRAAYDSYVTKLIYDKFVEMCGATPNVKLAQLLTVEDKRYGKVVNNDTLSFD